jgi:hypothetical protein
MTLETCCELTPGPTGRPRSEGHYAWLRSYFRAVGATEVGESADALTYTFTGGAPREGPVGLRPFKDVTLQITDEDGRPCLRVRVRYGAWSLLWLVLLPLMVGVILWREAPALAVLGAAAIGAALPGMDRYRFRRLIAKLAEQLNSGSGAGAGPPNGRLEPPGPPRAGARPTPGVA